MSSSSEVYDIIVVGAGATGGWAAQVLTERGLRVCLLDAGKLPELPPSAERYWSWENRLVPIPKEARQRQPVQSRGIMYHGLNYQYFVDDFDNPYTTPAAQPFQWLRGRQVGGRSLLWGGQTWRMSDHEFAQDAERAGGGWPLRYADLLPHYERVEKSLKMRGEVAGLDQLPDGHYSSPPGPLTYAERCFAEGLRQHWPDRPCVRIRSTNPELKHAGTRWPISSSLGSTIHEAKKTGLLRLLPDAVVWRVAETPGRPQLRRVEFVHRETREPGHVDGRAVVLGASTIESVRLLLNSTSERHPRGLGNSSGSLGRGLMDHWFRVVAARLPPGWTTPAAEAPLFWNGDGLYIPRFRNLGGQKEAFSGGYGIWVSMGRSGVAGVGETPAHELAQFIAFGETMSNDDNRVLLDPVTRDAWGIPSARVEFSYSENEQLAAQDAVAEICTMAKRFGLEILQEGSLLDPGLSIHEVGSARMGADRALSVTDPYNRLWDDPQVLVVDGACWPTAGYQNPTLTMMALTVRATERLAQQLSRGD